MTVNEIMDLVLSADPNALHYFTTDGGDFTVWKETRRLVEVMADNSIYLAGWHFTIDRFTHEEFDPICEAIEHALASDRRVVYQYTVSADAETGYIRHTFECDGEG